MIITKRGLKKPDGNDEVLIDDLNNNVDKLEQILDAQDTNIASRLEAVGGNAKDVIVEFTEAGADAELVSKSKLSTLFGLIKKKFNVVREEMEQKADKGKTITRQNWQSINGTLADFIKTQITAGNVYGSLWCNTASDLNGLNGFITWKSEFGATGIIFVELNNTTTGKTYCRRLRHSTGIWEESKWQEQVTVDKIESLDDFDFISIPDGTDFNTLTIPGVYSWMAISGFIHAPINIPAFGKMIVSEGIKNTTSCIQKIIGYNHITYKIVEISREKLNDSMYSWTPWSTQANTDKVDILWSGNLNLSTTPQTITLTQDIADYNYLLITHGSGAKNIGTLTEGTSVGEFMVRPNFKEDFINGNNVYTYMHNVKIVLQRIDATSISIWSSANLSLFRRIKGVKIGG